VVGDFMAIREVASLLAGILLAAGVAPTEAAAD
jgi:hypothetical protein